ncbi:MAG TPA: PspC domain-containing protein [Nocardioidaceae bacterium]
MTETPQQDRIDTEHLRDYSDLRRSVTDRKVAGVAGGLGRHLNIDPTILRVAFVVLAFFGGAGLLLYGALWLFVPEEGSDEAVIATNPSTRTALLIGAAVVATFLLLGDSWGGAGFPWPLLLVAVVVAVVLMNRDKPVNPTPQPPGQPPSHDPTAPEQGAPTGTAVEDTTVYPYDPYGGVVPPTPASYPVQQPPAPRPDRGPRLFWFTVALLAVVLGSLGLYDVTQGGVADGAYAAAALALIGAMLVVGAWFGRPGGLILLGVVASIALVSTTVAEPSFEGERRQENTPTLATQVEDSYFVPAGAMSLDLSNIRDVERLDGRTIEVGANAGEIVVVLPDGVDVDVRAKVAAAGEVTVLDQTRGGIGVTLQQTVDGGEDVPEVTLDLDLIVGSIEVRQ